MGNSIIGDRSFKFSLHIIDFYKASNSKVGKYDPVLLQLLKSDTSIGANVEEAIGAQSKKDFLSKISIAYKEARETRYWIKIITEGNYIVEDESSKELLRETNEICRILGKIISTTKKRI